MLNLTKIKKTKTEATHAILKVTKISHRK